MGSSGWSARLLLSRRAPSPAADPASPGGLDAMGGWRDYTHAAGGVGQCVDGGQFDPCPHVL